MTTTVHPAVWVAWGVAAVVSVQIAPNPVYVAAVLVACAAVVVARGRPGPLAKAFPVLLFVGAVFVTLRIALVGLTTRGSGPTLFTLPAVELPTALGGFTIGGPLDGGVLLRSAAEGFVIVGIMAVCGAFNAVIDHHQMLRLAPRAYAEMGVAVAVAIAFVPAFLDAARAADEADRARTGGVRVRRGRVRRLTGPVIERALEQAVALSESMDSRGFGRGGATAADARATAAGVVGMVLTAAGLAVLATGETAVAVVLVVVGAATIVAGVVLASRTSTRTRHRVVRAQRRDYVLGAIVLGAPLLLAALAAGGEASLRWIGDDLAWPPSTVAPLAAIALLAAPALHRREEPR